MFILNGLGLVESGFGLGFYQNLDLLRVFFLTQTQPYSLSGWVKPDPLGSGWAKYPRVEQKLPSLHINQKKNGKIGEMALKLDIGKAYDKVEWVCLEKIMEKLGFNSRWRGLMMQCISFVSYSVYINGCP